jgi:calcium-dependent protein kinase
MLCGYPPFNGPNDNVIMHKVAKGVYDFNGEEWKQISNEAKNFIRKMLEYSPEKRYSAELANADPWMRKWAQEDQVEVPLMTRALENMRSFRVKIEHD